MNVPLCTAQYLSRSLILHIHPLERISTTLPLRATDLIEIGNVVSQRIEGTERKMGLYVAAWIVLVPAKLTST